MNYIKAFNSYIDESNIIYTLQSINLKDKICFRSQPQYTTMVTKELVHNISSKSKHAINKLNSFKILEDNWDSYSAIKPSEISIKNAIEFIKLADEDSLQVFFTAPGRNGDVLVEYKISDKISSEIYFNSDGSNELLIFSNSDCIIEGRIEDNYIELVKYNNENRR